ncbi:MAG: hypothetical protein HC853_08330 [Anaerolineae bacterium]|nr:hypothetical protein [Anaerolineae bacterium]
MSWVAAYLQQADPRSAFYKLRVMRLPKWTGQIAPLRAMPQLSMPYHLMAFDAAGNWGHRLVEGTVCHGYAVLGKAHASWPHVVVECGVEGEKLAFMQCDEWPVAITSP